MATITKRAGKSGVRWRAQIRRKGYPSQVQTFGSKADAEAWVRQVESLMDKRAFVPLGEAENTTLYEALERYLTEVTPHKKGKRQEAARIDLLKRMTISEYHLTSLRSSDIAKFRDNLLADGKAPTTIRNLTTIISQVYEKARTEWGMEGLRNPVRGLPMPKHRPGRNRRLVRHKDAAKDEEARLLQAAAASSSPWMKPVIIVALETGMRLGEILSLQRNHVDFKKRVAHLPETKNGAARNVPLSTRAMTAIKDAPASVGGLVFPIDVVKFENSFRTIRKKAGLEDFRFHDLRHEATSRLFERGLQLEEVAEITGHKTWNMLRRYTHLKAEDIAKKLG